jgi:hypothetical protein
MRARLTVLLVAVSAACAQQPAVIAEDTSPDDLLQSEAPGLDSTWAAATPRQRCYVQVFEENDFDGRACMVPCILEGRGAMIGGGCWHICYSRADRRQPTSSDFSSCPAPEPPPPFVPPSVVCTADSPGRALRIALVDADTDRPISTARIAVESLDERLITDDSGEAQVVDPPTGPFEIYAFAARYLSQRASLIVPEQSQCNVIFKLMTTRGHGF